jgi:hypothetical protein
MVAIPELVRSAAKATVPDRTVLTKVAEYALGQLVGCVETESTLELIMTGLQVHYAAAMRILKVGLLRDDCWPYSLACSM